MPRDDGEMTCRRNIFGAGALFLTLAGTLLLYAGSPSRGTYPAAIGGILTFFLGQIIWFRSRLRLDLPLCPINLATLLFALQLVVLPLLGLFWGFQPGMLQRLPKDQYINLAIACSSLGYLSFVIVYHCSARIGERQSRLSFEQRPLCYPYHAMGFIIVLYLAAGLLGLIGYYGNLNQFLEYLSAPSFQKTLQNSQESTLSGALGNMSRTFFGAGLVLAWCVWVDRNKMLNRSILTWGTIGLLGLLFIANASYNRGTVLGPIAALAATYSSRVRRLSFRFLLLAGTAVIALALLWGEYRATKLTLSELVTTNGLSRLIDNLDALNNVEVYGGGPQFLGFLLQEVDRDDIPLHWGQSLVASLLHPVPLLGKPFRESSTVTFYNKLVYGYLNSADQVVPFLGELYLNFHVVGIVVGFGLLGYVINIFQRRYESAENSFETYAWFFVSMWTLFLVVGSVAVVSQMCVYFFWPFYVYWLLKWKLGISHQADRVKLEPLHAGWSRSQTASLDRSGHQAPGFDRSEKHSW